MRSIHHVPFFRGELILASAVSDVASNPKTANCPPHCRIQPPADFGRNKRGGDVAKSCLMLRYFVQSFYLAPPCLNHVKTLARCPTYFQRIYCTSTTDLMSIYPNGRTTFRPVRLDGSRLFSCGFGRRCFPRARDISGRAEDYCESSLPKLRV